MALLFMHIHKTAGTSLTRVLEQAFAPEAICPLNCDHQIAQADDLGRYQFFRGHISPGVLAQKIGPVKTVTLLRNPFARLRSAYLYWRRAALEEWPGITPMIRACGSLTFDEFLSCEMTRPAADNVQARLLEGGRFGLSPEERTMVFDAEPHPIEVLGVAEDMRRVVDNACAIVGMSPPAIPWENRGETGDVACDQALLARATHRDWDVYRAHV